MKSLLTVLILGVALCGCDNREAPAPYGKPAAPDGKPVEAAMVKDPVCGMMVDSTKAKTATHKDVKYYFCSEGCQDRFDKAPETFTVPKPAK